MTGNNKIGFVGIGAMGTPNFSGCPCPDACFQRVSADDIVCC